jgi:hypothetical protein
MKYLPKLLLLVCTEFTLLTAVLAAQSAADFQTKRADGGIAIISYTGAAKDVRIPLELGGVKVLEIGDYAFSFNQLTSVTIPNSVTSIGNFAFDHNQLTNITIPDGVTSIKSSAFYKNRLTSVIIPNSVISIEYGAFADNQLTSVTIPNGVTFIEYGAFANNQLASVTIPSSVKEIKGGSPFLGNLRLTSILVANGNPAYTSIEGVLFSKNKTVLVAYPAAKGNTY